MSARGAAERIVKRVLARLGFEIKRSAPTGLELRTTLGECYTHLRGLGAQPATVIDVGVAGGTEELYTRFPGAYLLLIEPLVDFESDMTAILKRYDGDYVLAVAGDGPGEVEFNVHDHHLDGSSIYREAMGPEADGHQITVPMVRIDDLVEERGLDAPFLIKVDAQGAELKVLAGALGTLEKTEIVVLEVSFFEFMSGAPVFHDVISFMHEHGFVAYDIVLGWNRPLDGALGQADVVFVREDSSYRRDHSYATVEQRFS